MGAHGAALPAVLRHPPLPWPVAAALKAEVIQVQPPKHVGGGGQHHHAPGGALHARAYATRHSRSQVRWGWVMPDGSGSRRQAWRARKPRGGRGLRRRTWAFILGRSSWVRKKWPMWLVPICARMQGRGAGVRGR